MPKSTEKPSRKSGGYTNSKEGLHLEWDVLMVHMGVIVRCPQTFGLFSVPKRNKGRATNTQKQATLV